MATKKETVEADRARLLMLEVLPRLQQARQALVRAGFQSRLATPGRESWTKDNAGDYALFLLWDVDDLIRAHRMKWGQATKPEPKKGAK